MSRWGRHSCLPFTGVGHFTDPFLRSLMPACTPSASDRLFDLYRLLRAHFGYHAEWWPGGRFGVFVTALLVQQCDWSAAWAACRRLWEDGLGDEQKITAARSDRLRKLIAPVAFYPTKSVRLRALCRAVVDRAGTLDAFFAPGRETAVIRDELLDCRGIGPETADAILLYAAARPVFVIDANTVRVGERLGLFGRGGRSRARRDRGGRSAIAPHPQPLSPVGRGAKRARAARSTKRDYDALQRAWQRAADGALDRYAELHFDPSVPLKVALYRDLHAQITELAKHHCLKTRPRCHEQGRRGWNGYAICRSHCLEGACRACPLVQACPFGLTMQRE